MLTDGVYTKILRALGKKKRPGRAIHPSSFGCVRQMVFEVIGFPARSNVSPDNRQLLDTGKALHQMVQDQLKAGIGSVIPGAVFTPEVKIHYSSNERAKSFLVSGSADGLFELPEGEKELLEIKTVGANAISTLTKVKPEHFEQANAYMYFLDVPKCVFMYLCRSNTDLRKIFPPIPFDKAVWDETAMKISLALDAAVQEQLPPVSTGDFTCRICAYAYACRDKEKWIDAETLRAETGVRDLGAGEGASTGSGVR